MTTIAPYFRPVLSRPHAAIAESVAENASDPLRGLLLRMLREAPGFARDIASGTGTDLFTVQSALDLLSAAELVIAVPEETDSWYALSAREVEVAVDAVMTDSVEKKQNRGL